MSWKETDPASERRRFVEMYLKRRYDTAALCAIFGVSRKTGYKYIRRFEQGGLEGLKDRSTAAKSHPNQTEQKVVDRLIAAKHDRPHWGPEKLLAWLRSKDADVNWPAVSTAGEILKRAGLVKERSRRRRTSHPGRPKVGPLTRPNQVNNMDYKGHFRTLDGRYCYPLTMTDSYSRALLVCQGFLEPTHENTKRALEQCYRKNGLPEAVRSDNGLPFVSSQSIGGLSRLGVWHIRLGIELIRARPASPQDNATHERMHRTLKQETARPPAGNLSEQQKRFDAFIDEYNNERPHASLEGNTPASRYEQSPREFPDRLPPILYDNHMEVRSVRTDGTIKWRGEHWFISECLEGEKLGLQEIDDGILELYFGKTILGILDEREERILGSTVRP